MIMTNGDYNKSIIIKNSYINKSHDDDDDFNNNDSDYDVAVIMLHR